MKRLAKFGALGLGALWFYYLGYQTCRKDVRDNWTASRPVPEYLPQPQSESRPAPRSVDEIKTLFKEHFDKDSVCCAQCNHLEATHYDNGCLICDCDTFLKVDAT